MLIVERKDSTSKLLTLSTSHALKSFSRCIRHCFETKMR
jgi:hypothetical protein